MGHKSTKESMEMSYPIVKKHMETYQQLQTPKEEYAELRLTIQVVDTS